MQKNLQNNLNKKQYKINKRSKVVKISGIYKITNTITGDFYIGSSNDVKQRWASHKCTSTWKNHPNNQLYKDMQKYGTYKFVFELLAEVEPEELKVAEQQFIETLKPTYNQMNANGLDVERRKKYCKEYQKEYQKTEKGKKSYKESQKEYQKTEKGKKSNRKAVNKYQNQLCFYNGETLTLRALSIRFLRKGIIHPVLEAKKYLLH